jgi:tetratricopeptide (TPR) repeat protein
LAFGLTGVAHEAAGIHHPVKARTVASEKADFSIQIANREAAVVTSSVRRFSLIAVALLGLAFWPASPALAQSSKGKPALAQSSQADKLDAKALELSGAGKYAEAIATEQQAVAIREKTFGPDHPSIVVSLTNLAFFYHYQGRNAEAEPLFERALAIRQKAFRPDDPNIEEALYNLGLFYGNQDRYAAEAESFYKQALAIREKRLGRDHPDVATLLNNMAVVYENQGRYADAEPLYKRALAIRSHSRG